MNTTNDCSTPPNQIPASAPRLRRHLNRVGSASAISTSEPTTVGARMVERRLKMGLTQARVSGTVRGPSGRLLSRNTYSMYETGKYEPGLEVIEQIAITLEVSPGWLAFGQKDAKAPDEQSGSIAPFSVSFRWSGVEVRTIEALG